MFKNQSVIYSPYGAYELKATYQRNMLASTITVNGLVAIVAIVLIFFINSAAPDNVDDPIDIIETRRVLPPPPKIANDQPQVKVRPPKTKQPAVGLLVPVEDEEFIETEAEVETIDDHAKLSEFGENFSNSGYPDAGTYESIGEMPGLDQFIPNVQRPEFIYKAQPEYPRFDKMAGIEGTVWIAVEIDIDGSVTNAKIYKTSGRKSLDQAALDVAFENKFRPAIQNGHPVKLWTAYKVEFVLNE